MVQNKTVKAVCEKLEQGLPVHQKLPKGGLISIEKVLPFICVHRFKSPDEHFSGLLKTQASYLIVEESVDISSLLEAISKTISKKLNSFLILELWPIRVDHKGKFEIFCPDKRAPATVAALHKGFGEFEDIYPNASSEVIATEERHPKNLTSLLTIDVAKKVGALIIGIAIPVIYEKRESQEIYTLFYRRFVSKFSEVIKRAAYEFVRVQTANPFNHYLMLGKTQLDAVTKKADRELAKISEGMSFLLRTTPVNSTSQWRKFEKKKYKEPPAFNYRLIALDPELKKRKLYDLPIDKVEDPTISYILRDKRLEIEKQLTMLEERGTDNFRYIGESLYGTIQEKVLLGARSILKKYPTGEDPSDLDRFDCHEFAEQVRPEMEYYQNQFPDIKLSLEIRKDVAGIMVSKSKLLISDQFSLDARRCDALIQHELGTHILTYCNGRSQPLKQLYAGFAGYDKLQEGLAVFVEYLVGGLTKNRLRLLAGRVLAAESLIQGANFIETFDLLHHTHNFTPRVSYYITMRIYRGGGLTKDAVYLAGLIDVIDYVKSGKDLGLLYTGKFNTNHIELIEELLYRGVLKKPVLPLYLERQSVQQCLKAMPKNLELTDLLD